MGIFSSKKKISINDMAMQMMLTVPGVLGRIECFSDISEARSMAVNMAYFLGFLKLHLSSTNTLDIADIVVRKTINQFIRASKGQYLLKDFGKVVLEMSENVVENMKYAEKETDRIFLCMTAFYITDLHNSNTIDVSKVDISEKNLRDLYEITSKLTRDIKIVK